MQNPYFESRTTIPVILHRFTTALILVVLVSTSIITSGCQKSTGKLPLLYEESDWQRMGLHGNVSDLTLFEIDWEEAFGKIKLTSVAVIDQSTHFNNKGNQVDSEYYDIDGRVNNKDVFIYDSDGETWLECINHNSPGIESNASPQSGYTNYYDSDGRVYRIEGYDFGDSGEKLSPPSWVHIYEYLDEEGRILRSSYSSEGTLQWKNMTEYDSNAREIASAHYDDSGILQWRDEFKYNYDGNKTEWSRYDSEGVLQWKDILKYDENGNEIECANYDYRNILMWKDIYIYTVDVDDIQGYDVANIHNRENKFDSDGNWIVKITLEEKSGFGGTYLTVKEIEQRDITYFP